jgi:hypothetical protein
MASKLVVGFLNAIYYENVLEKESNEKFKYMLKTLKSTYSDDIFVYSRRCRKALLKIKTLVTLRDMYTFCAYEITKKNKDSKKRQSHIGSSQLKQKSNIPKIVNKLKNLEEIDFCHSHLITLQKSDLLALNNIEDIMSPKPYYEISFHISETKEKQILIKNKIIKTNSILFPRAFKKSTREKIRNFVTSYSEFSYKIEKERKNKLVAMTALQILDREWLNEEIRVKRKRSSLKAKLFVILFVSSYFFLFIMVTDIYNKYEDNIFKICITPLISVVVSKFLITQNIMILVHSFFMYKFGEKFYSDNRKNLNPLRIVFKYVIPPISKANHKAVLIFRRFSNQKQ